MKNKRKEENLLKDVFSVRGREHASSRITLVLATHQGPKVQTFRTPSGSEEAMEKRREEEDKTPKRKRPGAQQYRGEGATWVPCASTRAQRRAARESRPTSQETTRGKKGIGKRKERKWKRVLPGNKKLN